MPPSVIHAASYGPRVGQWLPQPENHEVIRQWLAKIIDHVDAHDEPLVPVIQHFKDLVDSDPGLHTAFTKMFEEVPTRPPYDKDPVGTKQIRDYDQMFKLFNHIITIAPSWSDDGEKAGLVGFPINAILDWPMATRSGHEVFLNPRVNAEFSEMFKVWSKFLGEPSSAEVLNPSESGWLSKDVLGVLSKAAAAGSKPVLDFEHYFRCDPKAKHYGYKSWDDFFTRQFKEGIRSIAAADADDSVIVNACESAPYRLVHSVQEKQQFWVKGQPYSLTDMLHADEYVSQFVGGTVYQAFLSALSYHRWHAPVSGNIVKVLKVAGTYYSEASEESFPNPDKSGPNLSQGYITAVATRAIIFIEADNKDIGLMCIMPVGMAEVSTCDVKVKKGDHVKKGQELGMFHFGGSTHCLFFRPGVTLKWIDAATPKPDWNTEDNIPVLSRIATVKK